MQEEVRLLRSAPGVGPVNHADPELGSLSPKQAAALAGLAPFNADSGQFRGVRRIKGGRRRVRQALYMAAVAAVRSAQRFKVFYEKLRAKGKPAKLALIAIARKLIALNAMMREKTAFQTWQKHSCRTSLAAFRGDGFGSTNPLAGQAHEVLSYCLGIRFIRKPLRTFRSDALVPAASLRKSAKRFCGKSDAPPWASSLRQNRKGTFAGRCAGSSAGSRSAGLYLTCISLPAAHARRYSKLRPAHFSHMAMHDPECPSGRITRQQQGAAFAPHDLGPAISQ